MKKFILYLIAAAMILSLSLPLLSSCSDKDGEDPNENGSGTESESVTAPWHYAPDGQGGTVVFPNGVTTEAPTAAVTEAPTESTRAETTEATEPPVKETTEKPKNEETEPPKEVETEPPVSLKYYSYGNGTCAVSGIGSYKDVYVIIPERSPAGDIVTAIDDKAFYDNTSIKAIQIPSTVMSIGDMAFSGCSSLVYISVSESNKAFTEIGGVLYSKDKTKILLFPPANPATEIMISVNVTEIADMAFASSPSLKLIKYGGTLQDWSKIKVGDKNYGLYSASMTFAVTQ